MSLLMLYSAITSYKKSPLDVGLFVKQTTQNLASHWYNLKESGKYGMDGLYYGTRGYGKKSLQALSNLYYHETSQIDHPNNGELIRSWTLGLIPYDSYLIAAFMSASQSLITNKSQEVAIACAVMAAAVHISIYDPPESKIEVVDKMIYTASLLENAFMLSNANNNTLISTYLKYAKTAALEGVNPIVFYNSAIGYYAKEAISAVVFTFLRHEYFLTALPESAYIPGDSDSVANLVGALMGAYYGIKAFPKEYLQYIETPTLQLNNKKIEIDTLLNDLSINLKN